MNDRILVIGAGVSGLTTAHCLMELGYQVTIVADKPAEETASVVAGALWEWPPAVCGHHKDPDSLARSKRWCMFSYKKFRSLANNPETGVRMCPAVFYFRREVADVPKELHKMTEAAGHVDGFEHSADLILRYGINPDIGLKDAYSYSAPVIETDIYTSWLRQEMVRLGAEFKVRRISGELTDAEPILRQEFNVACVVNCSGLGAIELAGDAMQPLRGALVRVRNDGKAMPEISSAHCITHDDSIPDQNMVYIMPRGEDWALLGGIAEPGEWNTDIDLSNYKPIRDMHDRCQTFMPALKSAETDPATPVRVGLRPHREGNVRLEREPGHRIIHNYGHGGSGFTLSWGCAQEAAALATA